ECTSCHNPDKKKGGVDLSSYQALMAGSDSGPIVSPGDPDNSTLYKVVAHLEDPYMPKGKGKLQDKDVDIFKKWIAGGALQTASGKPAIARGKPKVNLSVIVKNTGKPAGPLPMPKDLLIEPVVHTRRPGALMCLASSPWAPLVAIGGQHQVLLYNTDTLDLLGVIPYPDGDPYVTRFSQSGGVLLIGGGVAAKSGHVDLYDVTTGRHITRVGDEFDAVIAADISPDQSTVALGGPGKTLKIYSTADGQLLHAIKKHTDWVTAIAYSPDGVLLASGDRAGGLWVWESKSGNEFYSLTGHKAGITSVCFRADSNILASASEDGTVKLWQMEEGKLVKSWNADPGGVTSVSFTHDGRIVTCGRDRVVRLWKPDGSGLLATKPFNDIALGATFDGEGTRVVAGDWSGTIRVFDSRTGKVLGELTADPPRIEDQLATCRKLLPEAQVAKDKSAAELTAAQSASHKAAVEVQAANVVLAEAKIALSSATKQEQQHLRQAEASATRTLESRSRQALAAAERLVRARIAAAQASARFNELQARLAKLNAAEFNVKLAAARTDLAGRQAELDKLKEEVATAKTAADKVEADLAAMHQLVAGGPARIAKARESLAQARKALPATVASRDAAQAALDQSLQKARNAAFRAQALSDNAANAAKSPKDLELASEAANAKADFDQANHELELADQLLLARSVAVSQAEGAIRSLQASIAKDQAALASAPTAVVSVQKTAEAAAGQLREKQAKFDQATQSVTRAQAVLSEMTAQYQRMMQQVSLLDPKALHQPQ
ncbi:MAG TPA: c-type cytochrome domain-containing protein, partial [Tepidisphaeraceae bacterium]|nr:c-type cytochrome domain-containing protein [Tepidisphaeraceae bacterium]